LESGSKCRPRQREGFRRPLILYLYNRFAYSCRDMEQITFRQAGIVNEMKQFELAAVDVSKDADAQRSFQVIKVPTIIFISPTAPSSSAPLATSPLMNSRTT
jgi:thiol:disulfide interchange protein